MLCKYAPADTLIVHVPDGAEAVEGRCNNLVAPEIEVADFVARKNLCCDLVYCLL